MNHDDTTSTTLRLRKDASEIRAITRAVRLAERAFLELIAQGAAHFIGRSEGQLAAELDHRMRDLGAEGPAFETIVAVGANSSRPHHRPGRRRVRKNEIVLIDWGARLAGYVSDLTRVVFTGTIPPKLAEMYEVVLSAQRAGFRSIRPGVQFGSVDAAAREVVRLAGFGERYLHGLGHGIGCEVHEAPALRRGASERLKSGVVVTIEPGLYVPGRGGIRIEDDILVTPQGARRLSRLPRQRERMRLR